MQKLTDVGKVFGRLTVQEELGARWVCRCVCGNTTLLKRYVVKNGNTRSCGCLHRERAAAINLKHGRANSRVKGYASRAYGVWQAMRDRCTNPNRIDYHRYGGRGITVCARWDTFTNFLADMGEPPVGLTLDRVDNTKGYEPSNCKWATRMEQAINRERAVTVVIERVRKLARHVAAENGISAGAFTQRYYKYKWTAEEACGLVPRNKA